MKSVEEIQVMLTSELWECISRIKSVKSDLDYYNEIMGDTSFLLAGLLGLLLEHEDDWDPKKWIDDSLLTQVHIIDNKLSIWGVMIWGIENTTEQWTDPFYFEIELNQNEVDFDTYTFLFCDLNNSAISYEEFKQNREYWESTEKNWKYVMKQ